MQNEQIKVLDHGYLALVDSWGSDEQIIEAARMSTAKDFKGWGPNWICTGQITHTQGSKYAANPSAGCFICGAPTTIRSGDEKLLRYLWEHKHSTPFEMAGLTIEVQAPIFVFRQWHRHRTQSYNEMSARYTPLPNVNYLPSVERLMVNSESNKQAGTAKGAYALTHDYSESFRSALTEQYMNAESIYQTSLLLGVPKELARIHLPVARYSRMRASANLRNWLAFLTLRLDPHAQYEIRVYAEALGKLIAEKFPRTWELFAEGLKP